MSRRRRTKPAATDERREPRSPPPDRSAIAQTAARSRSRRRSVFWGFGVAGVIAAVAVGGWWVFQRGSPPPPTPAPDTARMSAPVARAVQDARGAVELRPTDAAAWGGYGRILDAHHLYDDAVVAYAQALALDPKNFVWAYLLAVVEDFRGAEGSTILSHFEGAIALSPGFPPRSLSARRCVDRSRPDARGRGSVSTRDRTRPELCHGAPKSRPSGPRSGTDPGGDRAPGTRRRA